MSVTAQLRANARSAYRQLFRAAAVTFAGDEPILTAFRAKIHAEAIAAQSESDPVQYERHSSNAIEAASFLRKNIVQGAKLPPSSEEATQTWKLRFTKDTELGSNDTIMAHQSATDAVNTNPRSMNYSILKKASKQRTVPELKEEDLDESFVRGSGPGGQSVNKTRNNVQLLHKPTGLRVSCQETRSLATNRMLARRLLLEKLDQLVNPGLSKGDLAAAKQRERKRQRRKKARRKQLEEEEPDMT